MNIILKMMSYFLLIYTLFLFLLYFYQDKLLFSPPKRIFHEEDIEEYDNYNTIILNKGKNERILYFGGNSESVVLNAEIYKNEFKNKTVYLMNYRGYSGNKGIISEDNFKQDSLDLYDNIVDKYEKITVIGRSLGSGVATYLTSKRKNKINKLVLITPYDSIENIAKKKFPFFPISFILKNKFKSFESIKEIDNKNLKILIFLSEVDKMIPHNYTYNLIKNIKINYKKVMVENVNHNNIVFNEKYVKELSNFVND